MWLSKTLLTVQRNMVPPCAVLSIPVVVATKENVFCVGEDGCVGE